jgi:phenylacetate-CoA ligase
VGVLHVLEDGVALQYEPVEERDPTRVSPIVTDLWRTTQPIIRYRLNDILVLNREPCACACRFRRIERIEGRKDDIFHFHQEDGAVRLIFPDVIRRAVLLASDDIVDYEVVQDRVGSVRIHFVHRQKASYDAVAESLRRSVEQTLREYACTATSIEIEGRLPSRSRSEKRRRIRRMHS